MSNRSRSYRSAVGVLLTLLLVALGLAWAAPTSAQAATVVASEPRERQQLDEAPGWVTIAFEADVDSSVAKVIVADGNGENVTTGSLIVEGTNVTTQLRSGLDQGTYTVHYRIDGSNGEPRGGAFQFSFGKGSFTTLPDRSWSGSKNEPAVLSGSNPNASDAPEPPAGASTSAGVEVTQEGPAPTTEPSAGQTTGGTTSDPTDPSDSATDPSASTAPSSSAGAGSGGGSGATPYVIGGLLALVALGAGAVGVYRSRPGRVHE